MGAPAEASWTGSLQRFGLLVTLAVEVSNLRKAYGKSPALQGVSFSVDEGEVLALLGPNGAGKTTTVEILEGFQQRDLGSVRVLGFDPGLTERSFKERIGIVLQETALDPFLTVLETVDLLGQGYSGRLPLEQTLDMVGLTEQRHHRVGRLSGGQRRRVDMAVALIGDPAIIFLDEPTTGFDPTARRSAWEAIRGFAKRGTTILLTSHYLEEVQQLADRVVVINEGTVIAEGPPATIGGRQGRPVSIRFRVPAGELPPLSVPTADGGQEVLTDDPTCALHQLTTWAQERSLQLAELEVSRPSLEQVYLELIAGAGA